MLKNANNLERTYKEKRDKIRKTGRGGGGCFPYYQAMDELLGNKASVQSLSSQPLLHPTAQSTSAAFAFAASGSDLIFPPSDSFDDKENDKKTTQRVSQTGTKRNCTVKQKTAIEKWASKLSKGITETRKKLDERLKQLEQTERERVNVLTEIKNVIKE